MNEDLSTEIERLRASLMSSQMYAATQAVKGFTESLGRMEMLKEPKRMLCLDCGMEWVGRSRLQTHSCLCGGTDLVIEAASA